MKLSKLIKDLQAIKKEHGDIKVSVFTSDGEGDTEDPRICFEWMEGEPHPTEVTICDYTWVDAFR